MSQDLLAPIWTRLDTEPPVFFADRPEPEFTNVRDQLLRLGFVRQVEPSQFAMCFACGGGHVRRVRWIDDTRSGTRRAFIPCPNCGTVPIEGDRLHRWEVDTPALLSAVFTAAGGRPAVAEVVPGHLWYLGSVTWLGYSRQAYFTRASQSRSRAQVLASLQPRQRAILFHPTERAVNAWGAATHNLSIALESVASLNPDGVSFCTAVVEGRMVEAGFEAPKPKPPRKREERAVNIELLVQEMRQHLRDSRARAFLTRDLSGTPQLLPRPTQKELAVQCGLSESDVSRCINDPEAVLLKLLWETAADIDRVMAWDGTVGGDPPP